MWSSGEEHVRVMAFVGLTKLLRLISTTLVDFAIKVSGIGGLHEVLFCSRWWSSCISEVDHNLLPGNTYQNPPIA
jgi:hypothetical protein